MTLDQRQMNELLDIVITSFLPAFPIALMLFAFDLFIPKENDK